MIQGLLVGMFQITPGSIVLFFCGLVCVLWVLLDAEWDLSPIAVCFPFVAHENDIIYHKTWSNVVKFVRYGSDKKTDSYALAPKKDIPDRLFKFAVMPSGYLLCYNIVVQQPPGLTTGCVDVIDIATASRHHCFMDIEMGYMNSE